MKVSSSIRRLHEDQRAINDRLRATVDPRMLGLRNPQWHYESRVKELQSFALKIESGRFHDPGALEDFFACTIVVANTTEIIDAENIITRNFALRVRKPPSAEHTHKRSDAFPFDDLRLYVTLPDNPTLPPTGLAAVVFEVQIKTFLQHAWSIATHDGFYKADDANWSKERIGYQIKAMLEHAEVSIQEAENLARSGTLAKEDQETAVIKKGITLVKAQWGKDELPKDVRRLATNIIALAKGLSIEIDRLEKVLNDGKAARAGAHPSNLSPYATLVQYLFDAERDKMLSLLRSDKVRVRILIPQEIELPPDIERADLRNAVFVL